MGSFRSRSLPPIQVVPGQAIANRSEAFSWGRSSWYFSAPPGAGRGDLGGSYAGKNEKIGKTYAKPEREQALPLRLGRGEYLLGESIVIGGGAKNGRRCIEVGNRVAGFRQIATSEHLRVERRVGFGCALPAFLIVLRQLRPMQLVGWAEDAAVVAADGHVHRRLMVRCP